MSHDPPLATDALTPVELQPVALKLVVVSGPDTPRELVLEKGTYRVGKDPVCELSLTDGSVSRTHLLIEVLPHAVQLTDSGSTNGSYCEGVKFESVVARPPARIRVGRTELALLPRGSLVGAPVPSASERFGALTGRSLEMRRVFTVLERLATSEVDVLIDGETGTGKDVAARSLHAASSRAKRDFVVCDLASLAPTLAAAELFGHARGAFTGAAKDRPGLVERAQGGTLFLDEIGDFALELQPNLLRLLEQREVRRVGETHYRKVDVRVMAATHKDLEAEVRAGRFREDLFHRLAGVRVTLPPLRQRREDVPLLVDRILESLGKPPSTLSPQTRALLLAHQWPGNVRELGNVVERAVGLGALDADADAPSTGTASFKEMKDRLIAAFERDYLTDLMRRCEHNVSRAARDAGMDRVNLHRLLKKHGVG